MDRETLDPWYSQAQSKNAPWENQRKEALSIPVGLSRCWAVVYATVAVAVCSALAVHSLARSHPIWEHVTVTNHFAYPVRVEIGDYIAPNVPPGDRVGFEPPTYEEDTLPVRAYRPDTGRLVYLRSYFGPTYYGKYEGSKLDIEMP